LARKVATQIINDLSACGTDKHVHHRKFFFVQAEKVINVI